jgi:para-nitrobenzyl esterase
MRRHHQVVWQRICVAVLSLLGARGRAEEVVPSPVRTDGGWVRGVREDGLVVYKGIPFAAPPTGPRRWRPPAPLRAWQGVLDADHFAPPCFQSEEGSEDCLYLNIWTPSASDHKKRAVMVWIHGGSFVSGSPSYPMYRGERLAHQDLIVVNIAYRLGPFGFLAHPALSRESARKVSGNYALLDMIAALQWVHRNIEAFGGDSSRVTIFGESMGSKAVSLLMSTPLAGGLFQRAIGESGGFFGPPGTEYGLPALSSAEDNGELVARDLGARSLSDLRQMPAKEFPTVGKEWLPNIDGYVLPEGTYAAFAGHRQNDVPLLIGYNNDEGANVTPGPRATAAEFNLNAHAQLGERAAAFLSLYPASTDAQTRQSQQRFFRDAGFGLDMWTWARLQSSNSRSKVFFYYFSHRPPYPTHRGWDESGAVHGIELLYVFDHLNLYPDWHWTTEDRYLASAMPTYWANFAKMGDPNGPDLPQWIPFTRGNELVMHFDDEPQMGVLPDKPALEFLDGLLAPMRAKRSD